MVGRNTIYDRERDAFNYTLALWEIDVDGEALWNQSYASSPVESRAVAPWGDCFVLVGGKSRAGGGFDAYLARIDGGGGIVWEMIRHKEESRGICDIVPSCDGGFVCATGYWTESVQESDVGVFKVNEYSDTAHHIMVCTVRPGSTVLVVDRVVAERQTRNFQLLLVYPYQIDREDLVLESTDGKPVGKWSLLGSSNQIAVVINVTGWVADIVAS